MMYILLSGYPPFSGFCGQQCGWSQGGQCDECQMNLFTNIQQGRFEFSSARMERGVRGGQGPDPTTSRERCKEELSAKDVLNHEWLNNNNNAELTTPLKIRKDNSARQLSLFAESASAVNRVVLQHMS